MAYILDSNVLIEAKDRYYRFDFHPGFWEWLTDANRNGVLYSVGKVREELRAREDELSEWVRNCDGSFFVEPDDAVAASLQACSAWVTGSGNYDAAAVATFLGAADYYLVAQAHAHGDIVVTHEVPSGSRVKVKIPNACAGMNVECVNTFQMLSAVGVQFVIA